MLTFKVSIFLSSDEVKKIRNDYESGDDETRRRMEKRYGKRVIKRLIEDGAAEEWIQEYSKKCPRCKAHIEVTLKVTRGNINV